MNFEPTGEDKELRTSDPDGYLTKLQKQKQGPQYRPYTLKDFQNLKKDFKLGGLGPDKETMGYRVRPFKFDFESIAYGNQLLPAVMLA